MAHLLKPQGKMNGVVDTFELRGVQSHQVLIEAVFGDDGDRVQIGSAFSRHPIVVSQKYLRGDMAYTGGNWRYDYQ